MTSGGVIPLLRGLRARARSRFKKQLGADKETAELAAIALHPFVMTSQPPQSQEFDQLVRADSFRFAEQLEDVSDAEEVLELAREVVRNWLREASLKHEKRYQKEFYDALSASIRTDENPLDVIGPSHYWPRLGDLSYLQ